MLIDLLGAFLSFLTTYLLIRLNMLAWPIGVIATSMNAWLYWRRGIYADMYLEIFYCLSMGYGWYQWQVSNDRNSANQIATVRKLTSKEWLALPIVFLVIFLIIWFLLTNYTTSNIEVLDALTTSLSLIGQWLMCYKIIFTWAIWFIVDLIYAFMYYHKNIPFHCGLMLIYTGMALSGYWYWKNHYYDSDDQSIQRESNHSPV